MGWGIAPRGVGCWLVAVGRFCGGWCLGVGGYASPGCLSPGWRVADVWRCFPALASCRVFRLWHGRQSVCRFSSVLSPPCVIGVMWSISRCVGGAGVPQCWQVWWSRLRMCLRVWVGTCLVLVHMVGWGVLVWGGGWVCGVVCWWGWGCCYLMCVCLCLCVSVYMSVSD